MGRLRSSPPSVVAKCSNKRIPSANLAASISSSDSLALSRRSTTTIAVAIFREIPKKLEEVQPTSSPQLTGLAIALIVKESNASYSGTGGNGDCL